MDNPVSILVPMVIERSPQGERAYDIYSRLLKDRIILLGSPIDDQVANIAVASLLYLEREDEAKPINLYINSPGGVVSSGLAIYDTMRHVKPPVATVCVGQAASMGAILLAGGEKGMRSALPNAQIMIHQVSGGAQGQVSDLERQYRHAEHLKRRLNEILAQHTGKAFEQVTQDTDRDTWMTAEAAREYGLIDRVVDLK